MVSYIVCMFSCTHFDWKLDAFAFQVILGVCEVAKKCLCLCVCVWGGGGEGGVAGMRKYWSEEQVVQVI